MLPPSYCKRTTAVHAYPPIATVDADAARVMLLRAVAPLLTGPRPEPLADVVQAFRWFAELVPEHRAVCEELGGLLAVVAFYARRGAT